MIDKKRVFIPGKITAYLFCIVLVIVLIAGLVTTPFSSIFNASSEIVVFKLGYPLVFFELSTLSVNALPLKFGEMIVDLFLYFILAYVIELFIQMVILIASSNRNTQKTENNKRDSQRLEIMKNAKKAYDYYTQQGVAKEKLVSLFKEKGWTEQDIDIMSQLK